jgi:hypothetical protein
MLCFAGVVFAEKHDRNPEDRNRAVRAHAHEIDHRVKRVHAPEIDVGAAAGALTIVAGALTLLGERLRRS